MTLSIWLQALALLLILEGIPLFLGPARLREMMRTLVEEVSDRQLRVMGLLCMLSGLVLLYWVNP